jgi:hypothetical protein
MVGGVKARILWGLLILSIVAQVLLWVLPLPEEGDYSGRWVLGVWPAQRKPMSSKHEVPPANHDYGWVLKTPIEDRTWAIHDRHKLKVLFGVLFFIAGITLAVDYWQKWEDRKFKDLPPTRKTCPHCRTRIPFLATRCPNCTSELDPTSLY